MHSDREEDVTVATGRQLRRQVELIDVLMFVGCMASILSSMPAT
jgi:hypothetical protein